MNIHLRIVTLFMLLAVTLANPASATIPKVQEGTSTKGIKFWAIEDNYLPIVSLQMIFTKSGAAYDPENQQGQASMVANLLTEGAGGISGIEYMRQLEGLASSLRFSADEDNFYVTLTCLKENLDESLRLMALPLTSADFTKDAILRVRKSILATITRREESPEAHASKVFKENFFAGHPYARQVVGTAGGVNTISKNDLHSFAKNRFARQNMLIGITGNVTTREIAGLLDKHLLALPEKTGYIKDIEEFVPASNSGRIIKIEQDVPQSVIIFGFAGPKRNDPDFYNAYVMNHIFGSGGFESRLMQEVREKRGLAYTVYSYLQNYAKAGLISGYVATKNETVEEALQVIKEEISKMSKTGVTTQELADSKDYLVGSFPLRMTKNENLASFITAMQNDNLGINFLEKRNGYVKAVNIKGVNAAAKKFLDAEKMLVVVVGKSK